MQPLLGGDSLSQIAELFVSIKADMNDFNKNMGGLKGNLDKLGANLTKTGSALTKNVTAPILALGAGMLALATKTGNYADSLLDLEAATGHSVEAIQEWQAVAQRAGTNTDAVTNASQALTRSMARGEEGSADMRRAMEKLGLSMAEIQQMTPDDKMNAITQALREVDDAGERATLGNQLFRGSYEELAPILAMTNDQMTETIQLAHDSGKIMSGDAVNSADNFRIEMEKLKTEFQGLVRTMAVDFMPILTNELIPFIRDSVLPVLKSFAEAISGLIKWFTELSPTTQKIIGIMFAFVVVLGPVLLAIAKLITLFKVLAPLAGIVAGAVGMISLPVVLVAAAIAALIAAGVLLYKNWDKIKETAILVADTIKTAFKDAIDFVTGLFTSFVDAGKKIVDSIVEGIMSRINKVKDAIGKVTSGIRNFLPFSPAKEGALKDLDKLNFGGTIADSIYNGAGAISDAMNSSLSLPSVAGVGGGSSNITIELDGRTIARSVGNPLVGEIRARTGLSV